jgi:hypothetical protein
MVSDMPLHRPWSGHIQDHVTLKTLNSIIASTIPTYRRAGFDMAQNDHCRNCGHVHTQQDQSSSAHCFFITIRRSGRDRLPLPSPYSVAVPTSTTSQPESPYAIRTRDYIWSEFSDLKAEVDMDRDSLALQRSPKSKGQLKEKAPIPWLSWSSPTGEGGQTRNKANFFAIWDRVMEEAATMNRQLWVSSVLLPSSASQEGPVIWNEEMELDHYTAGLPQMQDKIAEKVILPIGSGRWDSHRRTGPVIS